jgi:Cytochrome c3
LTAVNTPPARRDYGDFNSHALQGGVMPINGLFSKSLGLAISTAVFFALSMGAVAQTAKEAPGNCQRCHASGLPLPDAHPKIKGASITECAACHTAQAGQAAPNAVAARLHRAHTRAQVDCTTCHAYAPGKQFAVLGHKGSLGAFDAAQY